MPNIDAARKIFGVSRAGIRWPYGLQDISCDRDAAFKGGPKVYNCWRADMNEQQELIIDWATSYGLRANYTDPCPRWLLRKASRSCSYNDCLWDHGWRDHPICWTRDRVPVAYTSAPYSLVETARQGVSEWVNKTPNTNFAIGTGWYGSRTIQVLVWRTDRIENMLPAGYEIL